MPAGRPSKYEPIFCDYLVDHMERGLSFESFAGKLRVSKVTLYAWAEAHEEFLNAKKVGEELSRVWWETTLTDLARGADGNVTAAIFGLKNRFPAEWRDRQQHEHMGDGGGPVIFQTIYEADKRGEK